MTKRKKDKKTNNAGADPWFQVRGRTLKNCAEWREARKFLEYFVWKITILRQKFIFFPILGGARAGCAPFWIRPCNDLQNTSVIICENPCNRVITVGVDTREYFHITVSLMKFVLYKASYIMNIILFHCSYWFLIE